MKGKKELDEACTPKLFLQRVNLETFCLKISLDPLAKLHSPTSQTETLLVGQNVV